MTYYPGDGLTALNTSARIKTIEDVRGNGTADYSFTYNSDAPTPHLASITNTIGTAENFSFTISNTQPLKDPFSQAPFGTTGSMQSLTQTGTSLVTSFGYGANNSAELTSVTFPYKATLSWAYQPFTYVGSRTQREIQNRYLVMSQGNTQYTYAMSQHDGADVNRNVHSYSLLDDPDGQSEKVWSFQTDTTQSNVGLLLSLQKRLHPGVTTGLMEDDYTWAADAAGDLYIGTLLTTADFGLSTQIQKKTTQTLDPGANGNVTQTQVFDWGNLSTPARTYTSTYLTNNQNYTARWMFNRLVQTQVTADGTHFTTLVQNTYDGVGLTDRPGIYEHDSNYNTSFQYRGNVTSTTSPGSTTNITYDIGGKVVTSTTNGLATNVSTTSATNFAAPSQLSTATSSSAMNYSSFLGVTSQTGQNGDSGSVIYDATARPSTSTSPYGAQTTYNYYDTAVPPYSQAATNGHWVKTYMDGFGRTITTQTGNGTTVVSNVDTNYTPCGCSPLGKVNATSQPYAVLANRVWTFNYYDGLGRTTSTAAPDNSTTTYVYAGNTVKVTDPAGKWKLFTSDAFGNLTQVQEPDPSLGTVTTSYTYDMLNHLSNVSMLRSGTTQQRVFNYIDPSTGTPGALLRSAQNPENGTVSYTYNANNLLSTKTDAKNQVLTYTYDSYNRLYQVLSGSTVLRTFYYDTNPLDNTGFSQYATGRLTAVQYATTVSHTIVVGDPPNTVSFVDMYSYTQAGLPAAKRLQTIEAQHYQSNPWLTTNSMNLDLSYTYDNEGKVTSVTYPGTGGPVYNYSFDSMSRLSGMTDAHNNTIVSNVSYGPANELKTMNYTLSSTSHAETRTYNNLLQLTNVTDTAGSLNMTYAYPAGSNNGKAGSQTDGISGEAVQYTYDSLNRLITAQAGSSWSENYTYDGFGNLSQKTATGGAPTLSVGINPTNNQIVSLGYDANGNVTSNSGVTLTYDAENRMTGVSSSPALQYAYDAENRRFFSWTGTLDTYGNASGYSLYVYDPSGQKLATYTITSTPQSPPYLSSTLGTSDMYFGSGRLAAMDRLSSAGKYYPYGEDKGTIYNDTWNYATYWRDSATGLDYAMNRYYNNSLGRFMTPDPMAVSARFANPASWNRYSYVQNDPVNSSDPLGLCNLDIAGINMKPGSNDAFDLYGGNDIEVYPYALTAGGALGLPGIPAGILQVAIQALGATTPAMSAVLGLYAAASDGKPIDITTFSGGASALTTAVNFLNNQGQTNVTSLINSVTYVSPGNVGSLFVTANPANTQIYTGNSLVDKAATLATKFGNIVPSQAPDCGHDFGCIANAFLLQSRQTNPCSHPRQIRQRGLDVNGWLDQMAHRFDWFSNPQWYFDSTGHPFIGGGGNE